MASRKKRTSSAPTALEPRGGFRGFGTQALLFLAALQENNDREWFAVNKSTYVEECDAPLRELVAEIGAGLAARGIPLAPLVRNPVFRIYRDVRFSKDKSPYKTHMGAALHRAGDKTRPGLLYIHVEPEGSFLAAGYYQPEPPLLKAFRSAIVAEPVGFAELVQVLESNGLRLDEGEPLARMPKGFEEHGGSPVAEAIRKRSWTTSQPLADDDLERHDLAEVAVRFAVAAWPLLGYFQGVVEPG